MRHISSSPSNTHTRSTTSPSSSSALVRQTPLNDRPITSSADTSSSSDEYLSQKALELRYISLGPEGVSNLSECTSLRSLLAFLGLTIPFSESSLTNAKPSAIYRLRPLLPADAQLDGVSAPASLGIEIAPTLQLEALINELGLGEAQGNNKGKGKEVVRNVDVAKVAEKVVKNLFNHLHSFGGDIKLTPDTPIPLSIFQQWYTNFTRKIESDHGVSFLERED
ncbi:MAG: hypothetical protein TREMPRED_004889 [Tremellales sp. Tagirdzhanova-0007]|nr:MAG: hypothetical protein TREMPRED_004889 [Tremellales sp. Tagirdzhanova-0007]